MLWLWVAALVGIFRFRSQAYWKWVGALALWSLAVSFLFQAGGTLDDPSGDGFITHYIRVVTGDGPGMGLFAIVFLIAHYAVVIYILYKARAGGKASEQNAALSDSNDGKHVPVARKIGEAVLVSALAAVWVYAVFVMPTQERKSTVRLEQPIGSPVSTPMPRRDEPDPIARELAQNAATLNARGPQQLDSITTLTRTTAEGRTLTYHYELSRRDGSDDALRAFARKGAVASACRDTNMMGDMRDYGVTYRYSYMFPNGENAVTVDASIVECRALGLAR